MGIFDQIRRIGIVPVIALDDAENAIPLAQALIRGGVPCLEITLRTPVALEVHSQNFLGNFRKCCWAREPF